jgi:hypothetical protein
VEAHAPVVATAGPRVDFLDLDTLRWLEAVLHTEHDPDREGTGARSVGPQRAPVRRWRSVGALDARQRGVVVQVVELDDVTLPAPRARSQASRSNESAYTIFLATFI